MTKKTEIVPAATELLTINPTVYVAAVYEPFILRLEDVITTAKDIETDAIQLVATKDGMVTVKNARAMFREIRIGADKKRAECKAPILEIGKMLESRYKEIAVLVGPHEDILDNAIKAEEQRIEDEKAAKIKAEAERNATIQKAMDEIKGAPLSSMTQSAESVADRIRELEQQVATEADFGERYVEAEIAIQTSIAQMKTMLEGKLAQEALAKQVEDQRIENERLAKIAAEEKQAAEARARAAQEAEAARLKEQQDIINEQRAAFERERKEFEDKQAKIAAEAEAKVRAEQEAKAQEESTQVQREKPPVSQSELAMTKGQDQVAERQSIPPNTAGPSRKKLISVIAFEFGVELDEAERWLCDAFAEVSA